MAAYEGWDGWQVYDEAGRRKYLNSAERNRFLCAADRLAPRMQALLHVLAYTGCRLSEALALTMAHVDVERLTLTIKTLKRRRTVFRVVPVPRAMVDMLSGLTPDAVGRFWSMHRVTAWRVVKAAMHRAGITGPRRAPRDCVTVSACELRVTTFPPTSFSVGWATLPPLRRPFT